MQNPDGNGRGISVTVAPVAETHSEPNPVNFLKSCHYDSEWSVNVAGSPNPVAAQTEPEVRFRGQTSEVEGDGPKAQTDVPRSIEHSMTVGRGNPRSSCLPLQSTKFP